MKDKAKELFDEYTNSETTIFDLEKKVLDLFNVSDSLLSEANDLVGHPATNISGSVDVACMNWREKYERLVNER